MAFKHIYILLPVYCTGGPELGHQLIDILRQNGQDAYVVYCNSDSILVDEQTPQPYQKYDIQTSNYIEDSKDNVLILPEIYLCWALKYNHITIMCWWMSVDNFTKGYLPDTPIVWKTNKSFYQNIRKIIHIIISRTPLVKNDILSFLRKNKGRVIHLYQSEYAHQYIMRKKLGISMPLGDYINPEFIPKTHIDPSGKEDIILYNPAKGLEFTQKVINALPQYQFVALKGYSRDELSLLMDRAKLYIDFGHFPGKDRLPRECALHDCCIITGRLGASAFTEDNPIPEQYKFDINVCDFFSIVMCIQNTMKNYDICLKDFKNYKSIISRELQVFRNEVDKLFS